MEEGSRCGGGRVGVGDAGECSTRVGGTSVGTGTGIGGTSVGTGTRIGGTGAQGVGGTGAPGVGGAW